MKFAKNLTRSVCMFSSILLLLHSTGCASTNQQNSSSVPGTETTAVTESNVIQTEPSTESATDPETVGNAVDWEKIGQEMQAQADRLTGSESDLKGFQFAVMDAGKMVVSGTSGQLPSLTTETLFGVASSSKMMAVAAVMQLVDQEKVDLDTPVTTYLPDFRMADERYQQITVRMLMNHSSGLMGNTNGGGAWRLGAFGNTEYHDKFMEMLSTQRLRSDPGKFSNYCNDGFTLLSYICEEVSGVPYAQYLRENIFTPLGMEHTFSPLEEFDTSKIAPSDFGGVGTLPPVTTEAVQGGMFSTAEDLCRLGSIFANGGAGVLTADSAAATGAQEYRSGIWCEDGMSTMNYGLGWDAVELYPFSELGIKAVTKNGDIILSGSQFIVLPEYHLVAAATGLGSSNSVAKNYLIYSLLRILQEKGEISEMPERPELAETEEEIPEEILDYAGTYIKGSIAYEIRFDGENMIKTNLPDGSETTYRHIGNGHFTDNDISDYWFTEQDGAKYQVSRTWDDGKELISLPNVMFQGAMTEKPELTEAIRDAWRSRKNQTYLLVSEPFDSFGYVYPGYGLSIPAYKLTVAADPDASPYWRRMLLTGENTAENIAEVPIYGCTNVVDAEFTKKDGTEYLSLSSGMVYRAADDLKPLDSAETIEAGETAQWYRIAESGTLQYEIPDGCAVIVYDSEYALKDHTLITGADTVTVEKDDYIAFVGNGSFIPAEQVS